MTRIPVALLSVLPELEALLSLAYGPEASPPGTARSESPQLFHVCLSLVPPLVAAPPVGLTQYWALRQT